MTSWSQSRKAQREAIDSELGIALIQELQHRSHMSVPRVGRLLA